ncbi:MAG TPA: sialate O-acetylesterase [Actinomycetota bacterium]|nr:sialate O-acetylesterase [Actinomycetota bacterium]
MRRLLGSAIRVLVCALLLAVGLTTTARSLAHAEEPIRVYVFAGQSNMVGKDTSATDLARIAPKAVPSSSVLFWGPVADFPTSWGPLTAPTEIVQPRWHQGFGPEMGAGPLLSRMHPDSTIAIVKFAASGTSLYRDWNPSRRGGLYDRLIARVREAVGTLRATREASVDLAGFFWMQGEADSERLRAASAYEGNLARFVRSVRRDLRAPSLPFVFGRITDLRRDSDVHFQYSHVVRRGQAGVARNVANTFMVSTDDLERARAQRIHFSSRGTYDLGRRFVKPAYPL